MKSNRIFSVSLLLLCVCVFLCSNLPNLSKNVYNYSYEDALVFKVTISRILVEEHFGGIGQQQRVKERGRENAGLLWILCVNKLQYVTNTTHVNLFQESTDYRPKEIIEVSVVGLLFQIEIE